MITFIGNTWARDIRDSASNKHKVLFLPAQKLKQKLIGLPLPPQNYWGTKKAEIEWGCEQQQPILECQRAITQWILLESYNLRDAQMIRCVSNFNCTRWCIGQNPFTASQW